MTMCFHCAAREATIPLPGMVEPTFCSTECDEASAQAGWDADTEEDWFFASCNEEYRPE